MMQESRAKLFLCATPVGNLEDISLRALRILKEVDYIACEDTRQTIKLLNYFQIKTPMISYHEHNESFRSKELIDKLNSGKNIALVSDAGTPGISDPGSVIIKEAIKNNIDIIPLPGASAFLLTLISSGFELSSFVYQGFLPKENKAKERLIESFNEESRTIVIYESPHHLKKTLNLLDKHLSERSICIGREITKKYEEFWRGLPAKAMEYFTETKIRGEFCIVISNQEKTVTEEFNQDLFELRLKELKEKGIRKKEISKTLASEFKLNAKNIYNQLIQEN